MNQDKCPGCGAALTQHQTVCAFCGRDMDPVINATWTDVNTQLPPPSQADSSRSDFVLTCIASPPLNQEDAEKRKEYYGDIVSAYYSFKKEEWINELLDETVSPIVSHWMPLPAEDAPGWIDAEEALPEQPAVYSPGYSIPVLTSTRGIDYKQSIIAASLSLQYKSWMYTYMYYFKDKDMMSPDIARWHPLPAAPVLEILNFHSSTPPASKGGLFSKLFGKK